MKIKKFLIGAAAGAVLFGSLAVSAFATPNWTLNAPKGISFGCGGTYNHTLNTVSQDANGDFTGAGTYNSNPGYTWNITGNITDNSINFALVYTGINSGYTLNGVGTIVAGGSISGTTNGNCQTFNMSAGSATILRHAVITSPTADSDVYGNVNFNAYLVDDDADAIQWAVRNGTCAAGTNTVFGNVDGRNDVAVIVQSDLSHQTFSFIGNMTSMSPGMYCFIYNPVEDSGESNIRKTVEFNVVQLAPTDINQCKKGGWETFVNPTFKNQGDCVSWIRANPNAEGNRKNN